MAKIVRMPKPVSTREKAAPTLSIPQSEYRVCGEETTSQILCGTSEYTLRFIIASFSGRARRKYFHGPSIPRLKQQ
jgi:hypothetical protein